MDHNKSHETQIERTIRIQRALIQKKNSELRRLRRNRVPEDYEVYEDWPVKILMDAENMSSKKEVYNIIGYAPFEYITFRSYLDGMDMTSFFAVNIRIIRQAYTMGPWVYSGGKIKPKSGVPIWEAKEYNEDEDNGYYVIDDKDIELLSNLPLPTSPIYESVKSELYDLPDRLRLLYVLQSKLIDQNGIMEPEVHIIS